MSLSLYPIDSLRFYTEDELQMRDMITRRFSSVVKSTLTGMNGAWKFFQVEGPLLTPRNYVSDSYDADDIFITQVTRANQQLVLRPETTASSYLYARKIAETTKFPFCVWQLGKSFRVEKSDGATASKLRFNEFYQLEFQCIYSDTTKADYRSKLIDALKIEVSRFLLGQEVRVVPSDRLPAYSESTLDIETMYNGDWKEVASCSIRTDYADNMKVCEIAFGIDRLTEIYTSQMPK